MRNKGQFFIISAVVILLVLFGMQASMRTEWNMDVSEEQGSDIAAVFRNMEQGLTYTISVSSPENLEENLDKFIAAQKDSVKGRYEFQISYNITPSIVLANVTLKATDFYAEKMINATR